jgi:type III restriction enzyme
MTVTLKFKPEVEAVNNHGGFGRWEFIEISDPWDGARTIRGQVVPQKSA